PQCPYGSTLSLHDALPILADRCGAPVVHVKPHGALYNQAVRNRELAEAIAKGVARWNREVVLIGLAGSLMLDVFREAGFAKDIQDRKSTRLNSSHGSISYA